MTTTLFIFFYSILSSLAHVCANVCVVQFINKISDYDLLVAEVQIEIYSSRTSPQLSSEHILVCIILHPAGISFGHF